jgi:hypothetical protein
VPDRIAYRFEVFQDQQALARAERRRPAWLGEKAAAPVVVPERETDVHDLRRLKEVGQVILGATRTPRQSAI